MEALLTPLKELASQENFLGSIASFFAQRNNCLLYYMQVMYTNSFEFRTKGIQKKLRVIFLVDPVAQPAYETLIETHQSMYKYSDKIWMANWSRKSMLAVAVRIVSG